MTMRLKDSDQAPTKHYCCLYHFTTGKKDKSSSPCYNHVPLGVINPIPTSMPRSPRLPPSDLKISAKHHEINYHTHDHNEIEHKQSLPKRLGYPRVYVEQINPKLNSSNTNVIANYEAFLKKKDFQEIFLMFKKYAKLTTLKTQEEAIRHIQKFTKSRGIESISNDLSGLPQYFYQKSDFINYLISAGFTDDQAEQFWEIAFNKSRFTLPSQKPSVNNLKNVVSMRAFAYNFKKFYLDELETYKNCLSQSSLRQRMIDLRLFLEPWFTSNIIFKQNHQKWKEIQLQICASLKRYGEEKLYMNMIASIEMRNKIWLFMRTLSKVFYQVTDQKNIGLEVFNQKATELIVKNKDNLQAFAEFLNHFETSLLQNNRTKEEKFKITDLLEYSKKKLPQSTTQVIASLRGLFKYLYFFKRQPLLSLNHQTLNLDCSAIAEVNYNELLEYLSFKQKETNHLMQMIEAVCKQINEIVDARPEINGHKRFLNQCNYLSECLLKMIRRCDFLVFYRLERARDMYQEDDIANLTRLAEILRESETGSEEITANFWKRTFSFEEEPEQEVTITERDESEEKNYQIALDSYEELRKKLEGKLPSYQQKNTQSNKDVESVRGSKSSNNPRSKKAKAEAKSQQPSIIEAKTPTSQNHTCLNSNYCSLCDDLCSTSVSQSLNKIDDMSNYLMDLLRDI